MSHTLRTTSSLLILLSLAVGLAGCRQPDAGGYKKTWSERWSESVAAWKTPEWEKQQKHHIEAPGLKPDEKMMAASMLEREGKIDRAIDVYEEILGKDKRRGDIHHRLAQLYDLNNEPDKALKHYKAALKLHPKDGDVLCDFGYHYYLVGNTTEAEKVLRQTIAGQPTLARAHNNLGLVLAQAGHPEEALGEFKRAGNDLATAHINLAYALMWEEHWQEAARHIDLALAADPSSKAARKAQASMTSIATKIPAPEKSAVQQANYAGAAAPPQQGAAPATR